MTSGQLEPLRSFPLAAPVGDYGIAAQFISTNADYGNSSDSGTHQLFAPADPSVQVQALDSTYQAGQTVRFRIGLSTGGGTIFGVDKTFTTSKDPAALHKWLMRAAEAARKQIFLRGGTDTDADKQALKEAKLGVWPNPLLLKARLLTDGGYTKEALAILQGKQQVFTSPADKLEYVYRIGRIYEDLGKEQEAISFYKETIKLGANQTAYFAARAALQAGQIVEKRGQKKEAILFYEQCLAMEEHSYKNSLDQRAKAGIARCK